MQKLDVYISKEAPGAKNALWLKPVEGGFVMYALYGGKWNPLKLVDDKDTDKVKDDTVQNLVGTVKDTGNADTINGAKAYADAAVDAVVGEDTDTSTDLTLYGLKAYVDAQIEALG